MRTLFIALLIGFAAIGSSAQQDQLAPGRLGLMFDYGLGVHAASFSELPEVQSCCPEYGTTMGSGWFLGLEYNVALAPSWRLATRLHYGSFGVDFASTETQPIVQPSGNEVQANIEHSLSGDLSQISIEPLALYEVAPDLSLAGGLTIGYVLSGTYEQKEYLATPTNAVFETGTRTRNSVSGDIQELNSLSLGVTVGARYDLALNADRTIFLTPEVLFTYVPTAVASGVSWNAHQLRGGMVLSFVPPDSPDELSDAELYEFARTATPPRSVGPGVPFVSSITASGVTDGRETSNLTSISIEEFASTRVRPVLPYVFFEHGSAELPTKYRRLNGDQADMFSTENFYNLDALTTYYHVLNIVGKRMQDEPAATITLTGCTDDQDVEKGNTALASERVNAVKAYLTSAWDVDASRIAVETRGLPAQPSNSNELDGQAENRRVEISSSSALILAPITSRDTMRVFTPSTVRFRPAIDPRVPVQSWNVFAAANDNVAAVFHGTETVPASVDWRPENSRALPRGIRSIDYVLVARDSSGVTVPSPAGTIAVTETTLQDKERLGTGRADRDRFSMILFGFDRSDLSPANSALVERIKATLRPTSKVTVTGHTDRSGDDSYNQRLSEQRARSVSTALGLPDTVASGKGESIELYDNSTPEGRLYSRTVEVIVETPTP
jgi:outer membrane protein OmpA-like peptidoglycan-associated protein